MTVPFRNQNTCMYSNKFASILSMDKCDSEESSFVNFDV